MRFVSAIRKVWNLLSVVSQAQWLWSITGSGVLMVLTALSSQPLWLIAFVGLGSFALILIAVHRLQIILEAKKLSGETHPKLQTYLSIVHGPSRMMTFMVKNLGPGDVRLVAQRQSIAGAAASSLRVNMMASIPEDGELLIPSLPFIDQGAEGTIELQLDFNSVPSGAELTCRYAYTLHASDQSKIAPFIWDQMPGYAVTNPSCVQGVAQQFEKGAGTIHLVLLKTCNGSPNSGGIETEGRRFVFDPERSMAFFERCNGSAVHRISAPLPVNDNDGYFIALSWDDASGDFKITVNEESFIEPETIYLLSR